jgi:hypothetical protein
MAQQSAEIERFRPTNGRVTGALGLLMSAFVAVILGIYEPPRVAVPGVLACLFLAVLVWLAMLRPGVAATATDLQVRTMFETVQIPLASIETVVVRRYLLVRSGGRRYICPAISRPLRKTVRAETSWRGQSSMALGVPAERLGDAGTDLREVPELAYSDFVEQRIAALAANDRARRGIEARSEEEYQLGSHVVRRTAWRELAVLAALTVAFVVTVVAL